MEFEYDWLGLDFGAGSWNVRHAQPGLSALRLNAGLRRMQPFMNADHNIEEAVNRVLSEWNPLSVPDYIAPSEYKGYVPQIAAIGGNADGLRAYLKHLVCETLGVGYDDANPEHREDLGRVVEKLVRLFN